MHRRLQTYTVAGRRAVLPVVMGRRWMGCVMPVPNRAMEQRQSRLMKFAFIYGVDGLGRIS